jgi:hypothetical protein
VTRKRTPDRSVIWSARFKEPIVLPDGGVLETLDDARQYILGQDAKVHHTATWEIALTNLMQAAEGGDAWIEFARVSLTRAIYTPNAVIPLGTRGTAPGKRAPRKKNA